MLVTPAIPQSQEYHDFADQREFLGNLLLSYIELSLSDFVHFYFLVDF